PTPTPTPVYTPAPTPTPTGSQSPDDFSFLGEGSTTANGIYFRASASTGAPILATLPRGARLGIIGQMGAWYYAYSYDLSRAGYIAARYVEYTPTGGQDPGDYTYVGTGETSANGIYFREAPSTSATVLATLPRNSELGIIGRTGNWYYAFSYEIMRVGYISAAYVDYTPYSESEFDTYGRTTANGINFRSAPSFSAPVIASLNKDSLLGIVALEGNWYYAYSFDAQSMGYIVASYVTEVAPPVSDPQPTPSPTPSPPTPDDDVLYTGIINANGVNFRSAPSLNAEIIGLLYSGDGVIVYSTSGEWHYVLHGDTFGYVHTDFVDITGEYSEPLPDGAIGRGLTTGNVNFRTGPSTEYPIIRTLPRGTELVLYSIVSGWYEAEADGVRGYVSGSYVEVTESNGSPDNGGNDELTPIATGITTTSVNFRSGPSTSSPKIALLPEGAQLTLYSLENGWYYADYLGTKGYVYAAYIQLIEAPSDPDPQPSPTPSPEAGAEGLTPAAGVTTGRLNLRVSPSTSADVITLLPRGTALAVIGTYGDWYYVSHEDVAGYVNKAYMQITDAGNVGIAAVSDSCSLINTHTTAQLNLRTAPTTAGSGIIVLMPNNAALSVYYVTDGWAFVRYDSIWGFAITTYIQL
ncbi:MAG: SH3 domain-containing protein, partial [Clostridia bacterium]|nr:SH3 domain-containing protein [Clostridia bacterium]